MIDWYKEGKKAKEADVQNALFNFIDKQDKKNFHFTDEDVNEFTRGWHDRKTKR
jgi:hypothetical protein